VLSVRQVGYDRSRTWAKTRRAGLAPRYWFLPLPVRNAIRSATRRTRVHALLKKAGL